MRRREDRAPKVDILLVYGGEAVDLQNAKSFRRTGTGTWALLQELGGKLFTLLLTESHDKAHLFVMNSTEDQGLLEGVSLWTRYRGYEVSQRGGSLLPGQPWIMDMTPRVRYRRDPDVSRLVCGEETPQDAKAWITKWARKAPHQKGFEKLRTAPVFVHTVGNGNYGGGDGIYPNLYWASCDAGHMAAAEILLAWANRSTLFKYRKGSVNPWRPTFGQAWNGNDRSRLLESFGWEADPNVLGNSFQQRVEGKAALDGQHLARLLHPAYQLAKSGYAFARVILEAAISDIQLSWTVRNDSSQGNPNFVWWGTHQLDADYPIGKGCHILGREFGHGLTGLAYGVDVFGPAAYLEDLDRMLDTGQALFSEEHGALLVIPKTDPVFGTELGAYWNKRDSGTTHGEQTDIPDDEFPDLQPQFEDGITYWASMLADAAIEDSSPLGAFFQEQAHGQLMENSHKIRVFGHPEWSSPDGSLWNRLICGHLEREDGSPYSLPQLLSQSPFGNPLTAYSGSL